MKHMKISDFKRKYTNMPVQIKAAFWFLICSFLQKGISVITTPIFTRLLNTQEYGQYTVFNSWLGIVTIIVSLNLSLGVYTQGLIKFDDKRKEFSSSLQGLSLTLTVGWTVIYLLFKDFFNQVMSLTTVQVLAMLIIIWSSSAFGFWSSEQRVLYKYRRLVILTLIVSVMQPLLGIIFIFYAEDKVTARILGILLAQIVIYTITFFVQMKNGKRFFSKRFWKYSLLFNLPLVPHYLSQTVLASADRIMIDNMVGSGEAGIYGLAYSLSQVMTLVNTALMQTLNPWFYEKIKNKDFGVIAPISYVCLVLVGLSNILLIALAPEAVAIFAPRAYYEAIWIIPPVALSSIFLFTYDLFAKFEFYYEKTHFIMAASIMGAAINIVLNYFFIARFGYMAAGYTTLICYIIFAICHYMFMNRICDKYINGIRPFYAKRLLGIIIIFMVIGFGFMTTYNVPWLRYSLLVAMIIILIIKRNSIKNMLNQVMALRK